MKVTPFDPNEEQIRLEDIVVPLSRISRFAGHTSMHYTVAQHSVLATNLARLYGITNNTILLYVLLHDAAEAYLGDIAAPLKSAVYVLAVEEDNGSMQYIPMSTVEHKLLDTIHKAFGLDKLSQQYKLMLPTVNELVKKFDRAALVVEAENMLPDDPIDQWTARYREQPEIRQVIDIAEGNLQVAAITPWSEAGAYAAFKNTFAELLDGAHKGLQETEDES
jgi:5'-deoxynucleotidase YfbR-like HD superfamily hydrolase